MDASSPIWVPSNFLALPEEQSSLDSSQVVVLPVPYDSTTSYRSGARDGPRAIIEASYNLEDYDLELDVDVAQVGIHTAPYLEPHMDGPRYMIDRVRDACDSFIGAGKTVAMLGGEHSLTTGAVEALLPRYPDLSVLYLDAHGDLRDEYMGTRWGHASVARRVSELCPLVHVGGRSFSQEEIIHVRKTEIPTFFWPPDHPLRHRNARLRNDRGLYESPLEPRGVLDADQVVAHLSGHVYVSVDLDVLDPGIMSSVGTPEPGGMDWLQTITLLRTVAENRRIVGFDAMELSPREGPEACSYLAAKLIFKLIAYSMTLLGNKGGHEGGDSRGDTR